MSDFEQYDYMRIQFKEELERYQSKETKRTYEYCIRVFGYWLDENGKTYNDFNRDDVQDYLNELTNKGKSAATVNKVYSAIRSFCKFIKRPDAVKEIRVVKAQSVKDRAPKSLRRLERIKLVEDIKKTENLRNIAIVSVFLNTGVRVEELTNINRDDVLIVSSEGELRVRQGKGNKERTLPLNKECRDALSDYLLTREDKHPALFLSRKKGRLGVRGVQHVLEPFKIHPHRLRHTFITDLVRKHDVVIAQSLSGHSSVEMLSRYSKPSAEDLQNAVENIYD